MRDVAVVDGVRPSLPNLATQLLHDAVAVGRAEVDLVRARVTARVSAAKVGVALIAAAAVFALLGAIGLVVGVTLALATLVGPGFAGLIVLVIGLVFAGVLGLIGGRQLTARPVVPAEGSR